jgi:hypothetical protein
VKSPNTEDRPRKSIALRLTGLCLGLAGVVATNVLAVYKVQVEVLFLTAVMFWFFGYDFWGYRYEPRFRASVIASLTLHAVVLAAIWPLLPIHLLWVLGIACVERFAVMLVGFKFMEREN